MRTLVAFIPLIAPHKRAIEALQDCPTRQNRLRVKPKKTIRQIDTGTVHPPDIAVEPRRDRRIPQLKPDDAMADEEVDWGMAGDDDDVVDFEGMDVDVSRECYLSQL
jgi:hypothetical protein